MHRSRLMLGLTMAGGFLASVLVLARTADPDPLTQVTEAVARGGAYAFTGETWLASPGGIQGREVSGEGDGTGGLRLTVGPAAYGIRWPAVTDSRGAPVASQLIAAIVPTGDPLALVAAGHSPVWRTDGEAETGGCRPADFRSWGRAYVRWWQTHSAFLPVNADAGGLQTFQAAGTVWIEPATNLPCRVRVEVDLPRLPGDQTGTGGADWHYTWAAFGGD